MAVHAETNCVLNTIPAYTSLLGGHFVYKSSTSSSGLTLPSANIIENLQDNPANWGYNVNIGANGIKIRHNEITLSDWTTNQLSFYNPITHNVDATLNSNGLTLIKGGISAGTPKQSGFVYLSSEDYPKGGANDISINGHAPGSDDPAWRQIIGTKFGVDANGTLYAENAHISGQITIGGHSDTLENEIEALQSNVEKTLIYDHTYEFLPNSSAPTSVRFTAHVYQSGVEITNNFDDSRFTWFYKSEKIAGEVPLLNNEANGQLINTGKTITIGAAIPVGFDENDGYLKFDDIDYGIEIIGKFTPPESSALATINNEPLADANGRRLLSSTRTSGETVKVRELSYTTSLASTDAVMVITSNDEKLVSLANLAAALNVGVSDVRIANISIVSGGIANIPLATSNVNGVMSATDKAKLDNLPTSFTSDVTDVQINNTSIVSNGVATIPFATINAGGLMSASDKVKLNNLPSSFVSDVTDVQISNVSIVTNGVAQIPFVNATVGGLMTSADKLKLDGLPSTFDAGVVDVKINTSSIVSNGIAEIPVASTTVDGVMSKEDKIKLNSLPSSFVSDVTDVQLAGTSILSNRVANIPLATTTTSGAMSAADKLKLNNLPDQIISDVTDVQIDSTSIVSNGIANIPIATDSVDGIMSKEDKSRLESLRVVVGGVGLVAINRLSFDPDRKSLKIFDVNMDILPTAPTSNGTYTLQVDVDGSGHTYSWV